MEITKIIRTGEKTIQIIWSEDCSIASDAETLALGDRITKAGYGDSTSGNCLTLEDVAKTPFVDGDAANDLTGWFPLRVPGQKVPKPIVPVESTGYAPEKE